MKISRKNFEVYFLDYWENSLDETQRQELAGFLKANPDLQDEFLDFRESVSMHLSPDEVIEFRKKQALTKPEISSTRYVDEQNFEDKIIAFLEGDLSSDEIIEFEEFISKNLHINREIDLYKKVFIKVDSGVIFKDKEGLKRNTISLYIKRFYIYGSAVAAILLLALVLFNPFNTSNFMGEATVISELSPIPDKPLPAYQPGITDLLSDNSQPSTKVFDADKQKLITDNQGQQIASIIYDGSENLELAIESFGRERTMPEIHSQLEPEREILLAATTFIQTKQIKQRMEMSGVFEDMILRDALRVDDDDAHEKGAFGRIIANLGKQIFGNDKTNPSLIAQVAELGKEKLSELKEDAPRFETVEQDGRKKTYFAVNENLSIRISKAGKQ